jgi:uncharacterized glyoxalase superfamily protein PhnB
MPLPSSTPSLTPELCCTSIDVSVAFYVDVLGFTVQFRRPEDGFAMLERHGARVMLDEIRDVSVTGTDRTWIVASLERPFGRGMNLQILTSDVDQLYARVQKAGATIFMPIEEKWYRCDARYLGHRQFIVQDPDGYLLRFAENLGERTHAPDQPFHHA